MTDAATLQAGFKAMADEANARLVGRGDEIQTALVALLSRQHHLQVGPPGTAKSLLADTITGLISGADLFSLLLTRQTKVEEVYGPISLKRMAEDDIVEFNTTGFLPTAHLFFGDEIFKSSAALLNTMLWLLNERNFRNAGEVHRVPLISGFFGSNEFPESKDLNALYDRIAFRHWIDDIESGGQFHQMIKAHMARTPLEPIVHLNDILAAHAHVDATPIPEDVLNGIWTIAEALRRVGVVVSSRTLANSTRILQAAAFLRGGAEVSRADLAILRHVLWSTPDQRKEVATIVMDNSAPLLKEAHEIQKIVDSLQADIAKSLDDPNPQQRAAKSVQHKAKLEKVTDEWKILKAKMSAEGIEYSRADELREQLRSCLDNAKVLLVEAEALGGGSN